MGQRRLRTKVGVVSVGTNEVSPTPPEIEVEISLVTAREDPVVVPKSKVGMGPVEVIEVLPTPPET